VPGIQVFVEPEGARSNYWLNALLLDESEADQRNELLEALNDAGVMSRPAWTLLHRLPMYCECPRGSLRVAEGLGRRIVNVPSSARLGHA
jgi:perosamine synthetase